MKKSLLALAVVAVAASANAATVYDKDGTSLYFDGRVQSVFYSGNHAKAGEHDSSIQNSGRFGIGGKTQITDWVAGLGYAQWDVANGSNNEGFKARDQWVGADFGEFGLLKAGRFLDSTYYAENVTDHYEDAAGTVQGKFNGERRGGQLMYTYDNYGFYGQLGFQTAQDNARIVSVANLLGGGAIAGVPKVDSWAIDSGFNGALGYTFDDVVFGPLSLRAGYNYLKGQKDGDLGQQTSQTVTVDEAGGVVLGDVEAAGNGLGFDKFKHATVGASWGNLGSGFYVAALYEYAKMTYNEQDVMSGAYDSIKNKGFELAAGYGFDNGVSFLVGYESSTLKGQNVAGEDKVKIKRIPVFVNYKMNPNFNVWAEAGFNAGSDHEVLGTRVDKKVDRQVFSLGARYTF